MVIDLYILIIVLLQQLFPKLFKPTAIVSGTAKDEAGVAVAGVALTLTNNSTAEVFSAVSAEDGGFVFAAMKAGNYTLDGYKDNGDGSHYAGTITFDVGAANITVDLTLVKTIVAGR